MTPQRRMLIAGGLLILVAVATLLGTISETPKPDPENGILCGQVCALRICQLRGAVVSTQSVVAEMPDSTGTHSLLDIAEFLDKQRIPTEGRRISVGELTAESFPCVAALNDPPHFVVLIQKDATAIHLFDFNGQRIVVPISEIEKRWSNAILIAKERLKPPVDSRIDAPSIQVDSLYKDIGWISRLSPPRDIEFSVQNVGRAELVISDLMVTCSCLESKLDATELKPGETTKLRLKYRPDSRTGRFEQSVVVTSNDPKHPVLQLTTAGIASVGLTINPEVIPLVLDLKSGTILPQYVFLTHPDHYSSFNVLAVKASNQSLNIREVEWNKPEKEQWYARLGSVGSVPDDSNSARTFRVLKVTVDNLNSFAAGDTATIEIETDVERFEHIQIPVVTGDVNPIRAFPSILEFRAASDVHGGKLNVKALFCGQVESCRIAGVGDDQIVPKSLTIAAQEKKQDHLLSVDLQISPEDLVSLSGSTISFEFNAATDELPFKLQVLPTLVAIDGNLSSSQLNEP